MTDNINYNKEKYSSENVKYRIQKRIGYIFFCFIIYMFLTNVFNFIFLAKKLKIGLDIFFNLILFVEALIFLWSTQKGHQKLKRILQIFLIFINGLLTIFADINQIYFGISFLIFGSLLILQYDFFENRVLNYIIFAVLILVCAVFMYQYFFAEEIPTGTIAPEITDPYKLNIYKILSIISRTIFIAIFLILFPSIYIDQANFFKSLNELVIKEKESLASFANIGMMLNSTVHNFNNKIVTFLSSEYIITTTISKYKDIIDEKDYEKILSTCEMVKHSSDDITLLIKDLRNLIKDKTNSNLQTFEVNKIMESIIKQFQLAYEKDNVSLELEKKEQTIFIKGSSINFIQIIENIIKNAIESRENPVIKIEVGIDQQPYISIKDNGPGISFCFDCKKNNCLYCKEFQIGKTTKHEGSGTGMVYVQQEIKRMNGKLKIESSKKEGTKIMVILPETATKQLEKLENIYLDKENSQAFKQV